MSSRPAVSIVMRTKHRPILFRRAIESVRAQSFTNWELIVVNDGGNPEETITAIDTYGLSARGRAQIVHNTVSRGAEAASNAGLRQCRGEYCVIHDDDDSWHPSFLATCIKTMEGSASCTQGVITHTTTVHEVIRNGVVMERERGPFNGDLLAVSLFRMANSNQFPPISFVYRRSVHESLGFYREDLPVLGDWEFNLRFLAKYNIAVVPQQLAFYHHRVEVTDSAYANTMMSKRSEYEIVDTMVRNEFLRNDLETGRFGIGTMVNVARKLEELSIGQTRLEGMVMHTALKSSE